MDPPVTAPGGDTDQDSDDSDEPAGKILHLPRRLLAAAAQKKVKRAKTGAGRQEQEDNTSDEDIDDQEAGRSWSQKNPQLVGTKIPEFAKMVLPDEVIASIDDYNAYDFYKLFQPESFAKMVVDQSRLYGGQKDLLKAASQVNLDVYRYSRKS
jgi:hypothetical protein